MVHRRTRQMVGPGALDQGMGLLVRILGTLALLILTVRPVFVGLSLTHVLVKYVTSVEFAEIFDCIRVTG